MIVSREGLGRLVWLGERCLSSGLTIEAPMIGFSLSFMLGYFAIFLLGFLQNAGQLCSGSLRGWIWMGKEMILLIRLGVLWVSIWIFSSVVRGGGWAFC